MSKEHQLVDSKLALPTGNDLSRTWLLFTVPASLKLFGPFMDLLCIFGLSWYLSLLYLFYNSHLPPRRKSMGFLWKEEVFQSGWLHDQASSTFSCSRTYSIDSDLWGLPITTTRLLTFLSSSFVNIVVCKKFMFLLFIQPILKNRHIRVVLTHMNNLKVVLGAHSTGQIWLQHNP